MVAMVMVLVVVVVEVVGIIKDMSIKSLYFSSEVGGGGGGGTGNKQINKPEQVSRGSGIDQLV